jgi:hypothetical protein
LTSKCSIHLQKAGTAEPPFCASSRSTDSVAQGTKHIFIIGWDAVVSGAILDKLSPVTRLLLAQIRRRFVIEARPLDTERRRAVEGLSLAPQHILLDARRLRDLQVPQQSIVKGDGRSLTIAAASILAKTAHP